MKILPKELTPELFSLVLGCKVPEIDEITKQQSLKNSSSVQSNCVCVLQHRA